jgi:sugar phosphate isomerase/epimerase
MAPPPSYRIAYASSGLAGHRLFDALVLLRDLGYRGVLLTLDVPHLDPYDDEIIVQVDRAATLLERLDLAVVVETGGRYVLDRARKHQPTLLSESGRRKRLDYLERAVRIARDLGAGVVSLWSGAKDAETAPAVADARLEAGLEELLSEARRCGVRLALEPEPGMWIADVAAWHDLARRLGDPADLQLSLDVGHLLVTGEGDPAAIIRAEAARCGLVAIEDMERGVHEHLPFGEGDLDLPSVLAALAGSEYAGLVAVELGRHSHAGPELARKSRDLLRSLGVPFHDDAS